jgi:hypothetical protein
MVPLAAALSLGGCAVPYVYRPTIGAVPESGYLVARYSIPPEASRGEVLVTSFGVTKLEVAPKTPAPMLHVRMGMTNTSSPVPWTIDAREQLATVAGLGPLTPRYANSDSGGPVVTVPAGQNRVLDLSYALAPGDQADRDVPYFDVTWKVHMGDRVIAQRTPFQRTESPYYAEGGLAPPGYFAVGLGWSPFWWYDPFWPYPVAAFGFPVVVPHGAFHTYAPYGHVYGGAGWRGTAVGHGYGGSWHGAHR